MKVFKETSINGVFEIDLFNLQDHRGTFVKTFHASTLQQYGLHGNFLESFYSVNNKGVIRGMHFQLPPFAHHKIVYCTSGKLIDVIVDLRKNSKTYGKYVTVELSGSNFKAVYLPIGVAHGFAVLQNNTCMVYLTSTEHKPSHDSGILFNSFGYNWPFKNAIHSDRDLTFKPLNEFESPF